MIIKSLIDLDIYKLSMQQVVCKLFPRVKVKHKFINRGKTKFPKGFASELLTDEGWTQMRRFKRLLVKSNPGAPKQIFQ